MKKYDFVFIYEVKNRELDSVLLMKYELERRGYTVAVVNTWKNDIIRPRPTNARVAVCYALYNDNILMFVRQFVNRCYKYVNLQWEQMGTNGTENAEGEFDSTGFYGLARKAVHISWGEYNYKKLTHKYNMENRCVRVCGNVGLDFLREQYKTFFYSKEEMISKYNMEGYEKIYLFVSSFSYADLPETVLNQDIYKKQGLDINKQCEISKVSRIEILKWFEKELIKHPKTLIIYRPHPAEKGAVILSEMEKQYSNFRVCGDLSIKQWILISDKVYLWWSTSIAEVLVAGKSCEILRPLPIPYINELQVYDGATFIETYADFDGNFEIEAISSIDQKNFETFYDIDAKIPSFIRVCDVLEEVLHDDSYSINNVDHLNETNKKRYVHNFKRIIMKLTLGNELIYSILKNLYGKRIIKNGKTIKMYKDDYDYSESMITRNSYTKEEIVEKANRIKIMLDASERN